VGSALDDLRAFPDEVKGEIGRSLMEVQHGNDPPQSKVMQGFGGASVREIVSDFDGDTYRAVYTVRFGSRIYALHAFQKKSHRGSKTDPADVNLIKQRLRRAEEMHREWEESQQ